MASLSKMLWDADKRVLREMFYPNDDSEKIYAPMEDNQTKSDKCDLDFFMWSIIAKKVAFKDNRMNSFNSAVVLKPMTCYDVQQYLIMCTLLVQLTDKNDVEGVEATKQKMAKFRSKFQIG